MSTTTILERGKDTQSIPLQNNLLSQKHVECPYKRLLQAPNLNFGYKKSDNKDTSCTSQSTSIIFNNKSSTTLSTLNRAKYSYKLLQGNQTAESATYSKSVRN